MVDICRLCILRFCKPSSSSSYSSSWSMICMRCMFVWFIWSRLATTVLSPDRPWSEKWIIRSGKLFLNNTSIIPILTITIKILIAKGLWPSMILRIDKIGHDIYPHNDWICLLSKLSISGKLSMEETKIIIDMPLSNRLWDDILPDTINIPITVTSAKAICVPITPNAILMLDWMMIYNGDVGATR